MIISGSKNTLSMESEQDSQDKNDELSEDTNQDQNSKDIENTEEDKVVEFKVARNIQISK